MEWWASQTRGTGCKVVYLQVDISGYSIWSVNQDQELKTAGALIEFAEVLNIRLGYLGFDRLFWRGDGGLFVRRYEHPGEANSICDAADKAFLWFEEWRRDKPSLRGLRITGSYDENVIVDQNPGSWFSTRLNAFLKYERSIGLLNAFVITDDLRKKMTPDGNDQKRFSHSRPVQLPPPSTSSITTWVDEIHAGRIEENPKRLVIWLETSRTSPELSIIKTVDDHPQYFEIGDSTVLHAAIDIGGYQNIEMTPIDPEQGWPDTGIPKELEEPWKSERDYLISRNVTGTKTSVAYCRNELTDDPSVRLEYRLVSYSSARAFHCALEARPKDAEKLVPTALTIASERTLFPNTLSVHTLVLLRGNAGSKELLLCHRVKKERAGSYNNNMWSASFEEQFNPVKSKRENQGTPLDEAADTSLEACVVRGLREELLGDDLGSSLPVTFYALQLERRILNYSFLAIADLPEMSFEDIKRSWPLARDSSEHDAIAAIPFTPESLLACLAARSLPEKLRKTIRVAGRSDLGPSDNEWHPTSQARFAMGLWYFQMASEPVKHHA